MYEPSYLRVKLDHDIYLAILAPLSKSRLHGKIPFRRADWLVHPTRPSIV